MIDYYEVDRLFQERIDAILHRAERTGRKSNRHLRRMSPLMKLKYRKWKRRQRENDDTFDIS